MASTWPCPVCGIGLLGPWGSDPHEEHRRQSRLVSEMADVLERLDALSEEEL